MTAAIIHVRFGNRTVCYCCGEPFTPRQAATLICDSCLKDQALLDATLDAIDGNENRLPKHPDGVA